MVVQKIPRNSKMMHGYIPDTPLNRARLWKKRLKSPKGEKSKVRQCDKWKIRGCGFGRRNKKLKRLANGGFFGTCRRYFFEMLKSNGSTVIPWSLAKMLVRYLEMHTIGFRFSSTCRWNFLECRCTASTISVQIRRIPCLTKTWCFLCGIIIQINQSWCYTWGKLWCLQTLRVVFDGCFFIREIATTPHFVVTEARSWHGNYQPSA